MQNQQLPKKVYILVPDKPAQIQQDSAMAANTLSSIIKTCLGPKAMQKMVLTKINSIEITNDGNSILREMDVSHPSARCLIELAKTQDDEIGDGTTSVVILASEILNEVAESLSRGMHPIRACSALSKALKICIKGLDSVCLDLEDDVEERMNVIRNSINTKICSVLKIPIEEMAYKTVEMIHTSTHKEEDYLKSSMKIEKILTPNFSMPEVVDGILINKDIIHPQMRRRIENPRIIGLDTPLEYKKGESQTSYEFSKKGDFTRALEVEEEQVRKMCDSILAHNPDIIICEKGISDLALSIFHAHNVTAIRRLKKTDTTRIFKAVGGRVISRVEDLEEKDVGVGCGLFEYLKYGEEYYCKFSKCQKPKACSVIIKGPTRDILNELERNFMDAVKVAKNIKTSPKLVPGGGATEMCMSKYLKEAISLSNVSVSSSSGSVPLSEEEGEILEKVANALSVIPNILLKNAGNLKPLETIFLLEKKQKESSFYGINGISGEIEDMREVIMEAYAVKKQCIQSAIQAVIQLIRIDGIIEGQ